MKLFNILLSGFLICVFLTACSQDKADKNDQKFVNPASDDQPQYSIQPDFKIKQEYNLDDEKSKALYMSYRFNRGCMHKDGDLIPFLYPHPDLRVGQRILERVSTLNEKRSTFVEQTHNINSINFFNRSVTSYEWINQYKVSDFFGPIVQMNPVGQRSCYSNGGPSNENGCVFNNIGMNSFYPGFNAKLNEIKADEENECFIKSPEGKKVRYFQGQYKDISGQLIEGVLITKEATGFVYCPNISAENPVGVGRYVSSKVYSNYTVTEMLNYCGGVEIYKSESLFIGDTRNEKLNFGRSIEKAFLWY